MSNRQFEDDACARLADEGVQGLSELFDEYRDRLRGAVSMRLDTRMRGRIDPSDVIQESFVEAQNRLDEYLQKPEVAPYVWIRFLTIQRLAILQRYHLGAQQRDARREVSADQPGPMMTSSVNLAACIIDSGMTPSGALKQAELQAQLQQALERIDETDREVLALRHFEQMSNQETAQALGLSASAASKRYYAALKRLQEIFAELFGESP